VKCEIAALAGEIPRESVVADTGVEQPRRRERLVGFRQRVETVLGQSIEGSLGCQVSVHRSNPFTISWKHLTTKPYRHDEPHRLNVKPYI